MFPLQQIKITATRTEDNFFFTIKSQNPSPQNIENKRKNYDKSENEK